MLTVVMQLFTFVASRLLINEVLLWPACWSLLVPAVGDEPLPSNAWLRCGCAITFSQKIEKLLPKQTKDRQIFLHHAPLNKILKFWTYTIHIFFPYLYRTGHLGDRKKRKIITNSTKLTWLFISPLLVQGVAGAPPSRCLGGALSCALRMGEAGDARGTSWLSAITVKVVVTAGDTLPVDALRFTPFGCGCAFVFVLDCILMTSGCALGFMPS